jgi:alkylation response protein AidB-like acyl-CoA dehydrogenase
LPLPAAIALKQLAKETAITDTVPDFVLNRLGAWRAQREGDARLPASPDRPSFPYAAYAELLELRGIRVSKPVEVGPARDKARPPASPA